MDPEYDQGQHGHAHRQYHQLACLAFSDSGATVRPRGGHDLSDVPGQAQERERDEDDQHGRQRLPQASGSTREAAGHNRKFRAERAERG